MELLSAIPVVDEHDEALMLYEDDEYVYFTDDRKDSVVEARFSTAERVMVGDAKDKALQPWMEKTRLSRCRLTKREKEKVSPMRY